MEILVYKNNCLVSSVELLPCSLSEEDIFIGLCQSYVKGKEVNFERGKHFFSFSNKEYMVFLCGSHINSERVKQRLHVLYFT
jgi:hypothetical protein